MYKRQAAVLVQAQRLTAMRRESRRPRRLTRDDLGLPGGTRTPDLLLRRQLLYPVELTDLALEASANITLYLKSR